ncbi:MAG: hypothetical protein IPJ88_11530 [Myxococcales bacterium]|nr:MAG: hypothetical protein IPJ88_11530 [Myxococcales bacterium]
MKKILSLLGALSCVWSCVADGASELGELGNAENAMGTHKALLTPNRFSFRRNSDPLGFSIRAAWEAANPDPIVRIEGKIVDDANPSYILGQTTMDDPYDKCSSFDPIPSNNTKAHFSCDFNPNTIAKDANNKREIIFIFALGNVDASVKDVRAQFDYYNSANEIVDSDSVILGVDTAIRAMRFDTTYYPTMDVYVPLESVHQDPANQPTSFLIYADWVSIYGEFFNYIRLTLDGIDPTSIVFVSNGPTGIGPTAITSPICSVIGTTQLIETAPGSGIMKPRVTYVCTTSTGSSWFEAPLRIQATTANPANYNATPTISHYSNLRLQGLFGKIDYDPNGPGYVPILDDSIESISVTVPMSYIYLPLAIK